jgi:hypothetical protein
MAFFTESGSLYQNVPFSRLSGGGADDRKASKN